MKLYSLHAVLLLSLFLVGHCVTVYAAADITSLTTYRCIFDGIMRKRGPQSIEVVSETPRRGRNAWKVYTAAAETTITEWAPIRIKVFTEDINKPQKHCKVVERNDHNTSSANLNKTCETKEPLKETMKTTLIQTIIPEAVRLHADRLLVKPLKEPLKVPTFENDEICRNFTVPEEHRTTGVPDADMVLYVTAGMGYETWAFPCAKNTEGRPIVGVMRIAVSELKTQSLIVRILAHEIAHALGFGYEEMKSLGMLTNVTRVRGGSGSVEVVGSPKTLEKARAHYACTTLQGMELENSEDEEVGLESHWSGRNAKDELMSPTIGDTAGYYTALTMAAFEDMKFYKANWGMEETMSWGNQTGCNFLNNKCTKNSPSEYPRMFCDVKEKKARCTSDRFAVGICSGHFLEEGANQTEIINALNINPNTAEGVYKTGNISTISLPDGVCNYVQPLFQRSHVVPMPIMCSLKQVDLFPGSLRGDDSWCLDAESLSARSVNATNATDMHSVDAVCAQVQCDGNQVKVKYLGGTEFLPCPEGGSITPSSTYFQGTGGKIKCPKYSEVCTMLPSGISLIKPKPTQQTTAPNDESLTKQNPTEEGPASSRRDGADVQLRPMSALIVIVTTVMVLTA